jgi:hypothetical protein
VRARRWPLAQRGTTAIGDRRRWLRPKEGEEGVGQVGPNDQERSRLGHLGRMAGGPILGKGNGVGLGCHGNQAEMSFGLRAKNRNLFCKFLIQGNEIQLKSFKYFQT